MTSKSQIVETLEDALATVRHERDSELERVRAQYDAQIQSIQSALQALNVETFNGALDSRPEVTSLSIGEDKLELVATYLKEHVRARQADIARALKLNSGTVSVALRRLQLDGIVQPGGKENGSRVWEASLVPAQAV